MKSLRIGLVLFCLTLVQAAPVLQAAQAAKASNSASNASLKEDEVRHRLLGLSEAVNSGDAQLAASFWAEDGNLIDECGAECRGRESLKNRFLQAFARRGSRKLSFHPERISFPAENVAIVSGEIGRTEGSVELPTSRFSLVMVKEADKWMLKEASETLIRETHAVDYLRELSWLIGRWKLGGSEARSQLEVQWDESRNFIRCRFTYPSNGGENVDRQVIGFDPRKKMIVSWHFAADGGFGYGEWHKTSDGWQVDFAGFGAEGTPMRAKNLFKPGGQDEFTWQSVEQSSGEESLPDSSEVKALRVKS